MLQNCRHVDWRGTPADVVVKDQAQCGSCWAFGATGTMEGAWFLATGSSRLFSEQQLVDCACALLCSTVACYCSVPSAVVRLVIDCACVAVRCYPAFLCLANESNHSPCAMAARRLPSELLFDHYWSVHLLCTLFGPAGGTTA